LNVLLAILVFLIAKLNINELDHVSQPKPQAASFGAMC
jgi:hypothetical protein